MSTLKQTLKKTVRLFSLEKNQSPLFFHGIKCLFWRLADFIPGHLGIATRALIGKYRFNYLGKNSYIHSHNTFFDGRNMDIGDNFYSGKYNYFAGGPIKIGDNVSLANHIIIETTDHLFDDITIPIRQQGIVRKPVIIENDVWIGDGVIILGGISIGKGSIIAAGSVVNKNISPYSVVVGNPCRVIRKRGKEGDKTNAQ